VVVTSAGAGRKATGNKVRAGVDNAGHGVPRFGSLPDAIQEGAAASIAPPHARDLRAAAIFGRPLEPDRSVVPVFRSAGDVTLAPVSLEKWRELRFQ